MKPRGLKNGEGGVFPIAAFHAACFAAASRDDVATTEVDDASSLERAEEKKDRATRNAAVSRSFRADIRRQRAQSIAA